MLIFSRFYLILVVAILLTTCRRKTLTVIPISVQIGNTSGMDVKNIYKTIIGIPGSGGSLTFDINNDGTNDFKYSIDWSGSSGTGYAAKQVLTVLNSNISLMGITYDDTTFLHYDTIIVNLGGGKVEIQRYKKYTFTQLSSTDSFVSLNHYPFKAKVMALSDTLKQPLLFLNTETILLEDNLTKIDSTYYSNDTTYSDYINLIINPVPFPLNKEIYFGFRYNDEGLMRLGWLKFIIIDNGQAKIIETAIQKN